MVLVGDGVFEVFIRDYILVENMVLLVNKIYIKVIRYVKVKS